MIVVFVFVLIILIALVWPRSYTIYRSGGLTAALSNGKQIHQATYKLALDGMAESNPRPMWPGDLTKSETDPVKDLAAFVELLIRNKYLDRGDVSELFAAPGIHPYNGQGRFSAQNSAFKIYLVSEADADDVLFLATKNYSFSRGLQKDAKPYGTKGAVIIRKGGDGLTISSQQAGNKNIGSMPGHHSKEDPGEETSGNVWQ